MPVIIGAGIGAAAGLGSGALNFFGAQSQSNAMKQAMQQYINYMQAQRQQFLTANAPVRERLMSFIPGTKQYNPEADPTLKTIQDNYGQSLQDLQKDVRGSGVQTGGVYTPGAKDRTTMLMGQNLAASRAQQVRDTQLSNERYAEGALPTYSPGFSSTPQLDPSAFTAGIMPGAGSYLSQGLMPGVYAGTDIASRLMKAKSNPYSDANYGMTPNANYGANTNSGTYFSSGDSYWL